MPSRRIVSTPNLAPVQDNAINPFGAFNSNTVNKLTRIVSQGKDVVVSGLEVLPGETNAISTICSNLVNTEYKNITRWQYNSDTVRVTATKKGDVQYISNFHVSSEDGNPISSMKIKYVVAKSDFDFSLYSGSNVTRGFKFAINIITGSPRKITFSVNNDSVSIDYPRQSGYKTEAYVNHTFNEDEDIVLGVTIVTDINDSATGSSEGVTYIEIQPPSVSLFNTPKYDVPLNLQYERGDIDGNTPIVNVHPVKSIRISEGIAIKDDVVLKSIAMSKSLVDQIVTLPISESTSWIKSNPYEPNDFDPEGSQKVYLLNGNPNGPIELTGNFENGVLKVRGKFNDVSYPDNEYAVPLIDDFGLSPADIELNVTNDADNVQDQENVTFYISSCLIGKYHGSLAFWYYTNSDGEKVVFKQSNLELAKNESDEYYVVYKEVGFTIPRAEFDFADPSKVGCVLAFGPMKVSGTKGDFDEDAVKYAYAVCYYSYFKNPEPNVSYYGLIRDTDYEDSTYQEDYLVLAKVRLVDAYTCDIINYKERQQYVLPDVARASQVNYSSELMTSEVGINEINAWREQPTDESASISDVPVNVSAALTQLALRRLDDITNENIKLKLKRDVTDTATNTTYAIKGIEDGALYCINNNDSISLYKTKRTLSDDETLASYRYNIPVDTTVLKGLNAGYVFVPNPWESVTDEETKYTPTCWVATEDGTTIPNSGWVIIKKNDTYFPEFQSVEASFILTKYSGTKIYEEDENIILPVIVTEPKSTFVCKNEYIPIEFVDSDSPDSHFYLSHTLDYLESEYYHDAGLNGYVDAADGTNISTVPDGKLAKKSTAFLPLASSEADSGITDLASRYPAISEEETILTFGTQSSSGKMLYAYYKQTGTTEYKKLTVSWLTKLLDRIPKTTIKDRLAIWSDTEGNLRVSSDTITESTVARAVLLTKNGTGTDGNMTMYKNDSDGSAILADSGIASTDVKNAVTMTKNGAGEDGNLVVYKDNGSGTNILTDSGLSLDTVNNAINSLSTMFIGPECSVDSVNYNATSDAISSSNSTLTKEYVAEHDGFLTASIRWDNNGTDGLRAQLLRPTEYAEEHSVDELMMEIRVFPNAEATNALWCHTQLTYPLKKGMRFRFAADNTLLMNTTYAYLQYRFIYVPDTATETSE